MSVDKQPFASEAAALLDDFAQDCVSNGVSFRALLDAQTDFIEQAGVSGVSNDYILTYLSAAVSLSKGALVDTNGSRYKVREPARLVDDGVFSVATLSKVGKGGA